MSKDLENTPRSYRVVKEIPKPTPLMTRNAEFIERMKYLKPGEVLCASFPPETTHEEMKRQRINHMQSAWWVFKKGSISTAIRGKKLYIWRKDLVVGLSPIPYKAVPAEEVEGLPEVFRADEVDLFNQALILNARS